MKVRMLSYCDENYKPIGDITIPILREYCEAHAIEFELHNEIKDNSTDVVWYKISLVTNALREVDYVIWSDVDVLICDINFDINNYFSCIKKTDLILSSDYNGLCLGFFIVKRSSWSIKLFETLSFLGNIKDSKTGLFGSINRKEQDALKLLSNYFENVSSNISNIPETIITNPKSAQFKQIPFAFHLWANGGIQKTLALINSLVNDRTLHG